MTKSNVTTRDMSKLTTQQLQHTLRDGWTQISEIEQRYNVSMLTGPTRGLYDCRRAEVAAAEVELRNRGEAVEPRGGTVDVPDIPPQLRNEPYDDDPRDQDPNTSADAQWSRFFGEDAKPIGRAREVKLNRREKLKRGDMRIAHFMRDLLGQKLGRRTSEAFREHEQRAMGLADGSKGGALLAPESVVFEIFQAVDQIAPALSSRRMYQSADAEAIRIARLDDDDRSGDEVATNVSLTRVKEGEDIPESEAHISGTRLELTNNSTLIHVHNDLLQDRSAGAEEAVRDASARAVALAQARDFFEGTGSGEPLGIWNGGDIYEVATSSAAGAIAIEDLAGMLSRLSNGEDASVWWIAHRSVMVALAGTTAAGGHTPAWITTGKDGVPTSLFGYPVAFSDAAKTLNTVGDVNLCRMSAAAYAFNGIEIAVSEHYRFQRDQTTFRVKIRDNGSPIRGNTHTDRQGYETANFVRLATRS